MAKHRDDSDGHKKVEPSRIVNLSKGGGSGGSGGGKHGGNDGGNGGKSK